MRDIAEELGIKQASLYYHFPEGKEQLFIAMAERLFHRHREGLSEALMAAGPLLRDQLHAAAAWLGSQRPVRFMGMMHADLAALSPDHKEHLDQVAYAAMFVPLRERFCAAQACGAIRPMHPDMLAGWFLWLMESLSYGESRMGAPPRDVMSNDLISMMLDGLRPRPEMAHSDFPEARLAER